METIIVPLNHTYEPPMHDILPLELRGIYTNQKDWTQLMNRLRHVLDSKSKTYNRIMSFIFIMFIVFVLLIIYDIFFHLSPLMDFVAFNIFCMVCILTLFGRCLRPNTVEIVRDECSVVNQGWANRHVMRELRLLKLANDSLQLCLVLPKQ